MIDAVWDVLCISLLYTVFCRSVRTDKTTRISVRLVMWLVGLASLLGISMPFYGWSPDWITVAILTPLVLMQFVMSRHWVHGVPSQFIKARFLIDHRRKADNR